MTALPGLLEKSSSRPEVVLSHDYFEQRKRVIQELNKLNTPPWLFNKDGRLVTVTDKGRVHSFHTQNLANLISARLNLKTSDNKHIPAAQLKQLSSSILSAQNEWSFPSLEGVVVHPQFSAEGRFVARSGYDAQTKIWFHLGDLKITGKHHLRPQDVTEAREFIFQELLSDFRFESESDRANALSIVLSALVRPMFTGPVPFYLVSAPTAGTGKSLLVAALTTVVNGVPTSPTPAVNNDDEWRKTIFSLLEEQPSYIVFDNINEFLNSQSFASVLTSTSFKGRRLGKTQMSEVANRSVWVGTANNPGMSLEISRRRIPIHLDTNTEKPYLRRVFRHSDLLAFVTQNRQQLLNAFCILVQHWLLQGQPRSEKTIGSFEGWASVVGGILESAGIPGFLDNYEKYLEDGNSESENLQAFFDAWIKKFGDKAVTAKQLVQELEVTDFAFLGFDEKPSVASLGKTLSKLKGRVVGSYRLQFGRRERGNFNTYKIELRGEQQESATEEETSALKGKATPKDFTKAYSRLSHDDSDCDIIVVPINPEAADEFEQRLRRIGKGLTVLSSGSEVSWKDYPLGDGKYCIFLVADFSELNSISGMAESAAQIGREVRYVDTRTVPDVLNATSLEDSALESIINNLYENLIELDGLVVCFVHEEWSLHIGDEGDAGVGEWMPPDSW